ncbi:MAG: SPFH domain-containing protein [Anaerolineae bacterium]|nr:SPFH domain-containing protein [Anaerolineae bacterium]
MRLALWLVLVFVASLLLWILIPDLWPLWIALGPTVAVLVLGLNIALELNGGYRIPFYLALFVWLGIVSAAMFYGQADRLLAAGLLPAFAVPLLGSGASLPARVLSSLVGGIWIAALATGAVLLGMTLLDYQRLRPTTDQKRFGTLGRAFRRALALVPAEWELRAGKLEVVRAPRSPHRERMGPGELHVQQGHLAILERDGVISGLKGTGIHWVRPMERIAMCVPLYRRSAQVKLDDVATKDGVTIESIELTILHGLTFEGGQRPVENGEFPYDEEIIKRKVWNASGSDWSEAVVAIAGREARKLLRKHSLKELLTMDRLQLDDLKAELAREINQVTQEYLGVGVTVTGIGRLCVSPAVVQGLTELVLSDFQREIAYNQALLQGKTMEELAHYRRNAFMLLYGALHDAAEEHPDVAQLLKMALLERLERVDWADSAGEGGGRRNGLDNLLKLVALDVLRMLPDRPEEEGRRESSDDRSPPTAGAQGS